MKRSGAMLRRGPGRRTCRRGFTLVEMAVTVAVVSILTVAIASAILIATHALPDAGHAMPPGVDVALAADQMAGELYSATSLTQYSPTMIEFTVNRGGADHTIRYEWSGTPGDPLTRQYDGGPADIVVEEVQEFNLSYSTKVDPDEPVPVIEGGEIELSSHVATNGGSTFSISNSDWIGQYFSPASLPPETVTWSVTRVLFEAQSSGQPRGFTRVQLCKATAGNLPAGSPLEEHTMSEADLGVEYAWREFQFSNVSGLSPGAGLCLVLEWGKDPHSANVRFDNAGGSGLLITTSRGSSWSHDSGRSLNYYVYGRVTTPDPNPPPPTGRLVSVEITLGTGEQPASRVLTSALTLNQPELPGQ